MNSITIQILVLIASFLFYRVLRAGFDNSWKAILVDFGVILFLFGLQYFMQKKQQTFPANEISRVFGAAFPEKITSVTDNFKLYKRYMISLHPKEHLYMDANQKKMIDLNVVNCSVSVDKQVKTLDTVEIYNPGFYMVQTSIYSDQAPYHAKLSILGDKNHTEKSIHNGENNFVVYMNGPDKLKFEIENGNQKCMITDQSSFYLVEL